MAVVTLIKGDTIAEIVTIYESDGITLIGDLTNGTVKFRITKNLDDEKADALYNNEALDISTNPTLSQAVLNVTRAVTKLWAIGQYYWELEYIDSATNYSHTYSDICKIRDSIYAGD